MIHLTNACRQVTQSMLYATVYSKTGTKWPPSKRPKIGSQDQLSLNAGKKYCRMLQWEHSAILLTCIIKLPFVIMIFVLSIFEWLFYCMFYCISLQGCFYLFSSIFIVSISFKLKGFSHLFIGMSPLSISGLLGGIFHFYSNFNIAFCK